MQSTLTNLMEYSTPHQVSGNQQHGYSGDGLYTGRPRGTSGGESDSDDDALLFLAVPAGWLVRLLAFLGELVASAILGLVFPVAALVGALRALPAAAASSLRRVARGLLAAACTFAALVAALLVSVLLGFVLVRRCVVEDPVTVRQQLFFDYTEAQPSAAVLLGGARGAVLPAGHSVSVSMALLLPDSYHNREVGMFQVTHVHVHLTDHGGGVELVVFRADKSRGGLGKWSHHGISDTAAHASVQERPSPAGADRAAVRAAHSGHAQRGPGRQPQGAAVQGRARPAQENRGHQSAAAAESRDGEPAPGVQGRGGRADGASVGEEPGARVQVDAMRVGVLLRVRRPRCLLGPASRAVREDEDEEEAVWC